MEFQCLFVYSIYSIYIIVNTVLRLYILIYSWFPSSSLLVIMQTMFVQVYCTALPYQNPKSFHDLFQCLFCEGDCNLPLPHQSADLFHMALVPACRFIPHTLAPHPALLLNMLFLHKMVPLLISLSLSLSIQLFVSFHHGGEK